MLQRTKDFEVVLTAVDGKDLLEQIERCMPDVLLLDVRMPQLDGTETLRYIVKNNYAVKVIIFTHYFVKFLALRLIEAGASAFLSKDAGYEEIVYAIRYVHQQGTLYDNAVVELLNVAEPDLSREGEAAAGLVKRELEVLDLLRQNHTNTEIADLLCISIRTVEGYRASILKKSGCTNLAAVIRFAVNNGLLPPI